MEKIAPGGINGSVLFLDIKNFLGISGIITPKEMCQFIMQVLEPLSDCISEHDGYICQVQGDAIMAVFGLSQSVQSHAMNAVQCALEMQKILAYMNPVNIGHVRVPLSARIGICSGELYACHIRIAGQKEFTVLGRTVNLAARYQKINKHYDTKILRDESVFAYIKEDIVTRKLDKVKIDGCDDRIQLYEVIYNRNSDIMFDSRLRIHYEKGLSYYLQGNWDQAIECFSKIAEDKAGYLLLKRSKHQKTLSESSEEHNKEE